MNQDQFKQAVKEFKEVYKLETGISLSDADAAKMAMNMLQLFDVLTK